MSAVEELAQAILDGRVNLWVGAQSDTEMLVTIEVKPKEEGEPTV